MGTKLSQRTCISKLCSPNYGKLDPYIQMSKLWDRTRYFFIIGPKMPHLELSKTINEIYKRSTFPMAYPFIDITVTLKKL